MTRSLLWLEPDTWNSISSAASVGTFLLAAVATAVAAKHLLYVRDTRLDQNRPYVMVTFEPSPVSFQWVDVVIQNVGAGPAKDVRIVPNPPLERAKEEEKFPLASARIFNEAIPMMPPAYQLRVYFDSMADRSEVDAPARFDFEVSYHDGHGHSWTETHVQDLGLLNDLLFTEVYGVHQGVKALRDIRDTLKKSPTLKSKVVSVVTETRSQFRARRQKEQEEWQGKIAAHQAKQKALQAEPTEDG